MIRPANHKEPCLRTILIDFAKGEMSMKKKLLSLLVAMAMVMSLLTVTAMAEEVINDGDSMSGATTVTTETDLRSALAAGGEVTLGCNLTIDADDTITIREDVETVLDLGTYTLAGVTDDPTKTMMGSLLPLTTKS